MSNTKDALTLQQRQLQRQAQQQVQQRQILAMMGIGQWVQPGSTTLKIADIIDNVTNPVAPVQPLIDDSISEAAIDDSSVNIITSTQPVLADIVDDKFKQSELISSTALLEAKNVETIHNVETTQSVAELVEPLVQKATAPVKPINTDVNVDNSHKNSLDKVAPFDLQGGRYGNWVLIVDIQALNNDSQKLWQNITQALSLDCETASFPICAGMDTAELANASFAGYIFKIGRSEESQVAALTKLADGLRHPNLTTVPTLEAMLADSSLKRQLWEQISQ